MTSNYQRALYNGFKLKEQWNTWSKYIKRVYIVVYDARWNVYFGNLISLFSIINMNTLLEEWIHSLFALPCDIDSFYWHRAHLTRPDMSHMVHLSLTLPCHMLVPTLLPPHTGQGVWPQPPQPRHTRSTPALSRSGDSSRLSSPDSLSLTRPASSWNRGQVIVN